jgi:hypothetical protein
MANLVKGEVPFDHEGKAFVFKFGTNTQAIIESRVNMSVGKFMEEKKESFGASDLRLIFWAGLYQKHRLSEEEVGDMIDAMGAQKVSEIFWQAVNSAASKMPKGNGVDADPPQPTLGPIGTNSSSVG